MLNGRKCKIVAAGDMQLEMVTGGILGSSAYLKCLCAALEDCSSRLKYGIKDGI